MVWISSVPYRSRPIHSLPLEGTTKGSTRISKTLPKNLINEKREIIVSLRN